MSILFVGDVHATADDLDDCNKLVDCIIDAIDSWEPDYLVFLGDQTHTHAILNVHVLNFWKETFQRLNSKVKRIICLVGNHDLPGNSGNKTVNSMATLDHLCMVVEDHMILDDVLYVGYQYKNKDFIDICNKNADIKTVVCHQTFQGATYENGFFAHDGIELSDLPKDQKYISGHIHSPQEMGRVLYTGAPRWRNLSDASVNERALLFLDDNGVMSSIETSDYVRRIVVLDINEGGPEVIDQFGYKFYVNIKNSDMVYYNVKGSTQFVDAMVAVIEKMTLQGAIRKFYTDSKTIKIKESEGIDKALMKFVDGFNVKTDKETIKKMIEDRVWKSH